LAQKYKTRTHKVLFDHDKPYGHKVEPNKKKQIPRKKKYNQKLLKE
jgi:hypothetical protein|tara:strand:- start:597 stop:734 length:138 start_codon:yes stop_codon:yes gene_type:complete